MNSWQSEFGNAFVGKRVLVTGATGFIGWRLCESLVALGAQVYGLSRTGRAKGILYDWETVAADLTDIEVVRVAVANAQPQLIFHLAGLVTGRQDLNLVLPTLQNNLAGTVHLLLTVVEIGCERIVVVGSSEEPAAGDPNDIPISPYAAAKAAASMYARMFHKVYALPVVVARPFMTYGPRQEPAKLIPYTILSLLRGENSHLSSGKVIYDFIYLVDVVRGLLKASIQPDLVGHTVDLGTGQGTRVQDVVGRLVELSGSSARPLFGIMPDRLGERSRVADREATSRLLGWEPAWSLSDGLRETIAWYRAGLKDTNGTG